MNDTYLSIPASLLNRVRSMLDTARIVVDKHNSGKLSSIPNDSIAIANLKEAVDFLSSGIASAHITSASDGIEETNERK